MPRKKVPKCPPFIIILYTLNRPRLPLRDSRRQEQDETGRMAVLSPREEVVLYGKEKFRII